MNNEKELLEKRKLKRNIIEEICKNDKSFVIATDKEEALKQFPMNGDYGDECKIEEMIISINRLYQYEKNRLKGLFTLGEANLITSGLDGVVYTPWNEDAITFEHSPDHCYFVDKDRLFEKLHKLNTFECFTVIRMAFEFWERNRILGGEELLKKIFGIK
ncbi:hypothetical protein [Clostridium sp. JS66]|uniref:hypothetical protein n=1 Tax=Clostridium sp. JS66 TaxID=3064705 RepID=UPI00298D8603|nr:hypothetical protein [Clostridium sp. JS66]WPC42808.1 hypothetical protein Q6H37_04885 [Clostridium sp. JS66]